MRKTRFHLPFSLISFLGGIVVVLFLTYIGLLAGVMSYAAITIQSSQSVTSDEASVATLEGQYLNAIATITTTNYLADGYVVPTTETYVQAKSATALR